MLQIARHMSRSAALPRMGAKTFVLCLILTATGCGGKTFAEDTRAEPPPPERSQGKPVDVLPEDPPPPRPSSPWKPPHLCWKPPDHYFHGLEHTTTEYVQGTRAPPTGGVVVPGEYVYERTIVYVDDAPPPSIVRGPESFVVLAVDVEELRIAAQYLSGIGFGSRIYETYSSGPFYIAGTQLLFVPDCTISNGDPSFTRHYTSGLSTLTLYTASWLDGVMRPAVDVYVMR